jgi:hypothetical protein
MKSRSSKRRSSKRRSSKRRSSKRSVKRSGKSGCSGGKLKLLSIKKSPNKEKKLRATFCTKQGRIKSVDFGAAGMSDYTKHKDPQRKKRYENRHKSRENWNDPTTRGSLSKYILWNKPSLQASIADYKRRFKL